MDIAEVNLGALLKALRTRFREAPPEGAIVGRTALRDAVAELTGCSLLEAEQLVDTLVLRGSIQLVRVPDGPEVWEIRDARPTT